MLMMLVGCRRIPLDDVPSDSDDACAEWLHKHFRQKVSETQVIYYSLSVIRETQGLLSVCS